MGLVNQRKQAWKRRKLRIRKKVRGSTQKPRLCVFRSTSHIYAQVIDDIKGETLAAFSSVEASFKDQPKFSGKIDAAKYVGRCIAERAKEKGVEKVVFDRNGFLYHGRVKAVSEGAREAGLKF